jgi:hypothetical protein
MFGWYVVIRGFSAFVDRLCSHNLDIRFEGAVFLAKALDVVFVQCR